MIKKQKHTPWLYFFMNVLGFENVHINIVYQRIWHEC
jgi:hypothetical protein